MGLAVARAWEYRASDTRDASIDRTGQVSGLL